MAERLTRRARRVAVEVRCSDGAGARPGASCPGARLGALLLAVMVALSPGARATGDGGQGAAQVAPQTRLGARQAASVEKHLATLHSELRITAAQEPLWQPLAAAMREGVVQLDRVYGQRDKRGGSMSAVDDLTSYGLVQTTRARNVQSLIGPFQKLYGSFSASQKRQADETFRAFIDNAVKSAR